MSSKCNRGIEKNFERSEPAEALSGAVVDERDNTVEIGLRNGSEIKAFWEEEAEKIVGVLVRAALPWLVRLCEIDESAELLLYRMEFRKL